MISFDPQSAELGPQPSRELPIFIGVDGLANGYSRVLLSRRLIRAMSVVAFSKILLLSLTLTIIALVSKSGENLKSYVLILIILAVLPLCGLLYLKLFSWFSSTSKRANWIIVIYIGISFPLSLWNVLDGISLSNFALLVVSLSIDTIIMCALVVGPIEILRASSTVRRIYSQSWSGTGIVADAAKLFDMPFVASLNRWGNWRIWMWMILAVAVEGFAFSWLLNLSRKFQNVADRQQIDSNLALGISILVLPLSFYIYHALLRRAGKIRLKARRLATESADEFIAIDGRSPILFLRSFADDYYIFGVEELPWYLRKFDPGSEYRTLEEMLLHALSSIGPVVTIADPSNSEIPIGAARWQLHNEEWQKFVIKQFDASGLVVIGTSDTVGVRWEIDTLKHIPDALSKTIFLCPPGITLDRSLLRNIFTAIGIGSVAMAHILEAKNPAHVLAMALLPSGPTCFTSHCLSENAYYCALQACLLGMTHDCELMDLHTEQKK